MLLQQELVADVARRLPREVHAGLAVRLQPIAREAEVGALRVHLHAEDATVEVLGALEVLGDQQKVIQFGDGHGGTLLVELSSVVMILTMPRTLLLALLLVAT